MGIMEVIQKLPAIRGAQKALHSGLARPDAVVLIDAPDLHLPLANAHGRWVYRPSVG